MLGLRPPARILCLKGSVLNPQEALLVSLACTCTKRGMRWQLEDFMTTNCHLNEQSLHPYILTSLHPYILVKQCNDTTHKIPHRDTIYVLSNDP